MFFAPQNDTNTNRIEPGKSMRRVVLRNIGIHLYRHHRLALIGLILLTALAAWKASRLEVEANLRSVTAPGRQSSSGWAPAEWLNPGYEPIYAVMKSDHPLDRAKAEAIVRLMSDALNDPEMFTEISPVSPAASASPQALLSSLYPADIARLKQILKGPGLPNTAIDMAQMIQSLPNSKNPAVFLG